MSTTQSDFIKKIEKELYSNKKYSPGYRERRNCDFIWVYPTDGCLNNEECHYEIYTDNNDVYVNIDFEGSFIDYFNTKVLPKKLGNHISDECNKHGYKSIKTKLDVDLSKNSFDDIFEKIITQLDKYELAYGGILRMAYDKIEICNHLKSNYNIVLTGAPGTGKTYLAQEIAEMLTANNSKSETSSVAQITRIQFHQSLDYTDFVEGLRPVPSNNSVPTFRRTDGIFKEFCANASLDPDNNYVFIIDEINRGEVSKIFGELFFSIDPGYRGKKGTITTQYQNLITDTNDPFIHGFYVPENVYIIGTMNDIDRSVDSLDFAFRRRFNWIPITAKESQGMFNNLDAWKYNIENKSGIPENISIIKNRMDNLNNEIIKSKYELSEDYQIGAAYFLKYTTYLKGITEDDKKQAFESLWKYNIQPLLREYLRGTDCTLDDLKNAYDTEALTD